MSISNRPSSPSSRVHSRSHSRARSNQNALHPAPYLDEGANELLLPEGPASEETVEFLHEFVHPHRRRDKRRADTEATLVAEQEVQSPEGTASDGNGDEEEEDWEALEKRPWYKRPSALWLLCTTPLSSIAMSACAAPRIEIYTLLACREHKPEYTVGDCPHDIGMNNSTLLPAYHLEASDTVPINDFQKPMLSFVTGPTADEITIGPLSQSNSSSKCASDPVVQAAAAKIIAVMTTTMGILSCLTTAFWGSVREHVKWYGRLRVLGISVIGVLFNDFIFIAAFFFSRKLPGGYWFLLLGPIVDGFLGGFTSMVAAIHAYIADVSSPGDRSRLFSLGAGLLFVGTAFGPSLGSLLVHVTRTPMAVFYMATAVHVLLAPYIWFIVPESLPKRTQLLNRRRAEKRHLEEARAEEQEALIHDDERTWKFTCIRALTRTKRVFTFLSPLSVFAPIKVANEYTSKMHRDWSLTFIAASFGFSSFVLGSYQYKFQYAAATFGWSSEELGYWLSLVGGSRAIYLTLMLPLIIKFFNRPKQPVQLPVEPSEPLISGHSESHPSDLSESSSFSHPSTSSGLVQRPTSQRQRSPSPSPHTLTPHTTVFDLRLARFSLGWEVICYALIPLAPTAVVFSVFGCLAAWGGGFGPAIQALALETYVRRNAVVGRQDPEEEDSLYAKGKGKMKQGEVETGRLFGAMSVVQAMCSQIFGPTLFGITYAATVGTYPIAIFWISTLCITLALLFTLLIRLPHGTPENRGVHIPGHVYPVSSGDSEEDLESARRPLRPRGVLEREDTLVDVRDVGVDGKKKEAGRSE